MKRIAMGVASMAMVFGGSATLATPAQAVTQDGLVNVNVGDVTILEDVRIGIAANVAAQICGVKVGPVAVLGRAVDRSGDTSELCTVGDQDAPVTLS